MYLQLLSFVYQADQQAFGVIHHLRRRLSKRGIGIVAEGHDTGIGDLERQKIFQPERLRLWVCPGVGRVAAESVHGHNAREKLRLAKRSQGG